MAPFYTAVAGACGLPCDNAPTIDSISKTDDTLNTCLGGGWETEWTLSITGTLQDGQEYYWEYADNSSGDNWTYWKRGTSTVETKGVLDIGSNATGEPTVDRYMKVRAYVVPEGESPPDECSGPTTSSQASRTNQKTCAE